MSRYGWVQLTRTCVFSGIQFTKHFIEFVFVETNQNLRILHLCWGQVELDKLRLSNLLVTRASGLSSNHLTSDSLSCQLVKSTWTVTPLKLHAQAVWGTPPSQVTLIVKKKFKTDHFSPKKFRWKWCNFQLAVWWQKIPKKMFMELFCEILLNERTLRLGSVAAVLVDSPQQSVDSTWGKTCLLLFTVCSCLYISMFY